MSRSKTKKTDKRSQTTYITGNKKNRNTLSSGTKDQREVRLYRRTGTSEKSFALVMPLKRPKQNPYSTPFFSCITLPCRQPALRHRSYSTLDEIIERLSRIELSLMDTSTDWDEFKKFVSLKIGVGPLKVDLLELLEKWVKGREKRRHG